MKMPREFKRVKEVSRVFPPGSSRLFEAKAGVRLRLVLGVLGVSVLPHWQVMVRKGSSWDLTSRHRRRDAAIRNGIIHLKRLDKLKAGR